MTVKRKAGRPPMPEEVKKIARDQRGEKHWRAQRRAGRLSTQEENLARALMNPASFAEIVLGMKLYPKQREVLESMALVGSKTTLAAANGGGKTAIIVAALVLWHQYLFPCGKVKAVSASWPQIEEQMWPAIRRFKNLFPEWKWLETPYFRSIDKETGLEGFFSGFSTNDPGKAEGHHGELPDSPLLYIVDEAKSAPVWLKGVVEGRVRPDRLLLVSSHGFSEGWFYESHTINKAHYNCFQISADDCPHITKEEIESIKSKWSGNPSFYNSVLGYGFMPLTEDAVINAVALEELYNNPPVKKPEGAIHGFCDFAWSNDGDENVLALRRGNVVTIEDRFNCDNLHGICDRFMSNFIRLGLESGSISGDEGSGGKMIMDELDRRGYILNRINNGGTAADDEHYANIAAEMWFEGSKQITLKSIVLPNDQDLKGQLLSRKRVTNSKGKLAVERKIDMKERGLPSPDLADACVPAGTLIHTDKGQIPIEQLKIGDLVLTPFGYSPITKLHQREVSELVKIGSFSGSLMLTGNHKIFTRESGWIRADQIKPTDKIESVNDICLWQLLNQSFTKAEPIAFKQLADIIKTKTGTAFPSDFFIESSGLSAMAPSQKGLMCTIKTWTGQTMGHPTMSLKRNQITPGSMFTTDLLTVQNVAPQCCEDLKMVAPPLPNGTIAKQELNGTASMVKKLWPNDWQILAVDIADIANKNSNWPHLGNINSVQLAAEINSASETILYGGIASYVEKAFQLTDIAEQPIVVEFVQQLQLSASVQVYNLTLAEENAYYANGFLVENCLGCLMPIGGYATGVCGFAAPMSLTGFQPAMISSWGDEG